MTAPPFIVWYKDWDCTQPMAPASNRATAAAMVRALDLELELSPYDHRGVEQSIRHFITDGEGLWVSCKNKGKRRVDLKKHGPGAHNGNWAWRGDNDNVSELFNLSFHPDPEDTYEFLRALDKHLEHDFSWLDRVYTKGDYRDIYNRYPKAFNLTDGKESSDDEEE